MSLTKEVKELLKDPEAIWQALSIDGVSYPFDSTLHGRNAAERKKIAKKIKIFDDKRAIAIGRMILEYQVETDSARISTAAFLEATIGHMVRKQIIKHLEKIAESK